MNPPNEDTVVKTESPASISEEVPNRLDSVLLLSSFGRMQNKNPAANGIASDAEITHHINGPVICFPDSTNQLNIKILDANRAAMASQSYFLDSIEYFVIFYIFIGQRDRQAFQINYCQNKFL